MFMPYSSTEIGTNKYPWSDLTLDLLIAGEAVTLGCIYAQAFQRTGLTLNRSALMAVSLVAAEFGALLGVGHLYKQRKITYFTAINLSSAVYLLPKTVLIVALTLAKLLPPPAAILAFGFYASLALKEQNRAWQHASIEKKEESF
ncbi:MAG: hypothetical protein IT584_01930 [Chlamydiae bacterium]|nr:hypothetical protein [Chlamydiota bacterium]